jgi:hypothetical protein
MKKVIDILGIVLPALIIILNIIRIFVKNTKGINGLTIFLAMLLLLGGTIRYFFFRGGGSNIPEHSRASLPVSKHSDAFNHSMGDILHAYFNMTEGFVNWDTAIINISGKELMTSLDSLKLEELKKDTTGIFESAVDPLLNAKTELASILADPSIAEKRGSFNILSDNLRTLLIAVKYDREKLYWQECPMAFGEDRPGNWLSKTKEVRNPYLGTKDPQYGDKMLNCGGPKDTIKFETAVDSTKRQ